MATHKFINNFAGGEWTPLLDGRSDVDKYDLACRTLQNFRVMEYGGARYRSGFQYVHAAKNGATQKTRLIPFRFSVDVRFILQFSHQAIRFVTNGAQVMDGGSPYEVVSPYAEADMFEVQFKQINDVMYFSHPSYSPYKLSRFGDTNWTMEPVAWSWPSLLDENITNRTLTVSHVTGASRTMTAAGGNLFEAGHVGSFWEVRHLREADSTVLNIDQVTVDGFGVRTVNTTPVTSTPMRIRGEWSVTTSNYWYGVLEVQRSEDGGSTWETIRKFTGESDRNVSASGTQIREAQLRLRYTALGDPFGSVVWKGTPPTNYVLAKAMLESQDAYVSGIVKVVGYTSPTVVTVDVIHELASTAATKIWSEGAWSTKRGFPRAVGLFEQRLYFGGTSNNPIRFWGSKVGDFESFEYGDADDAAVAFDIASTESNSIQWIEAQDVIQLGSSGGEFVASSGNRDEPVTPANVSVRGQSSYGSDYFGALTVNEAVLFVQRQGRVIREMGYSIERDRYGAAELTLLSEHLMASGVVQWGFARLPDPLLFVVMGNGELAVLTYNRDQNFTAWTRWATDGLVESVATVYGAQADEVWVCVKRTVGGNVVRYVERLAVDSEVQADVVHLDSSVTGTTENSTITGLGHLEGRVVRAVVNGAVVGDYTVASGAITVAGVSTFGKYVVGLPYTGIIKPMRMEVVQQNGPSQGRKRRVMEVVIRFHKTLGAKYGKDAVNLDQVEFRDMADVTDAAPPLFTGEKVVKWGPGNDRSADVVIVQDQPMPCVVLGLAVKWDVFGD